MYPNYILDWKIKFHYNKQEHKVTTIYAFSVKNCLTGISQEGTI